MILSYLRSRPGTEFSKQSWIVEVFSFRVNIEIFKKKYTNKWIKVRANQFICFISKCTRFKWLSSKVGIYKKDKSAVFEVILITTIMEIINSRILNYATIQFHSLSQMV